MLGADKEFKREDVSRLSVTGPGFYWGTLVQLCAGRAASYVPCATAITGTEERRESGEDKREFRRFECRMCAELGGRSVSR